MITRELPASEWHRLRGTDLEPLVTLRPESVVAIIVVEDDSEIVGHWALVTFTHMEGVGIRPDHQKSGAVARRLLSGMRKALSYRDIDGVLTGAQTAEVADLLERIKAKPVMMTYYWSQKSDAEQIGAAFHKTFEASAGHPPDHPPMPEHDRAVGAAIIKAFAGDVLDAERDYNAWARSSGFTEAAFRSFTDDGRLVVESGPYEFTIAPFGACEVRETCQSVPR